jgi:hypothetical protein
VGIEGAIWEDGGFAAVEFDPNVGIEGADGGITPDLLSLPTCFNFGIPPAKISPNWGTPEGREGTVEDDDGGPDDAPEEPAGFPTETDILLSNTGFDLSTVTVFFNLVPFLISPSKASRPAMKEGGGGAGPLPSAGGGGGGGGGGPAICGLFRL